MINSTKLMVIIVIALISLVLTGPFIVNYRTGINVWPVKEKRKTVSVNGILKVKQELL